MGLIKNIFRSRRMSKEEEHPKPQTEAVPDRAATESRPSPEQSAADMAPPSTNPSAKVPPPVQHFELADFEVRRTLGVGSFGRVQLVRHRPTDTFYAMKKMKKADILRQRQVEHTNNERALLGRTTSAVIEGAPEGAAGHPFLVKVICAFQDDHHLYIVMEYVSGGELFSLLRKVKVRLSSFSS